MLPVNSLPISSSSCRQLGAEPFGRADISWRGTLARSVMVGSAVGCRSPQTLSLKNY